MEEAWCLFLEKVGHGLALPPKVKDIARSVAKECVGMPHAITVLAGSMRGMDDTGGGDHHGPPKVNFWGDPMSPSKWKEEH
ncbi:disease resistance protein SUMM2-like, partial [Fagus crenata]